jgi:hypothetical protein
MFEIVKHFIVGISTCSCTGTSPYRGAITAARIYAVSEAGRLLTLISALQSRSLRSAFVIVCQPSSEVACRDLADA